MVDGYQVGLFIILGVVGLLLLVVGPNALFEYFAGVKKVEDPLKAEKIAEAWRIITEDKLGGVICTFLILICAVIPIIFFSSGFFTDTINQSWDYSKGGVVGFFAVLLLVLLTSTFFADFSKKLVGWMGSFSLKTTDAAGATVWNIWGIAKWIVIGVVLIVATTTIGVLSKGDGGWIGLVAAILPIIAMVLAGNGYLGKFSPVAAQAGGGDFTITPYPEGLCDVPGFGWAANSIAPTSIVLTQSIAWYYLVKQIATNNGHAAMIGTVSAGVFGLQWLALYWKGCLESYSLGVWSPLLAYALSAGFGSMGYWVDKNIPSSVGGSSGSGGSVKPTPTPDGLICPKGYIMRPDNTCVRKLGPGGTQFQDLPIAIGSEQPTSEPVDESQDAFVCEAYKDGELVTSTLVE